MIKKLWNYIGGINGLIFILYTNFILGTYAFTSKFHLETRYTVRYIFLIFIISLIVCPLILRYVKKININQQTYLNTKKDNRKWIALFFVVSMIVFLINYIAFYPGGFSIDSLNQYEQTINNSYNDWHPVLHTLLAFKLPLLITKGWIGSIILFQIIIFSLVLSYMAYSILIYTNKHYALFALAFILLNPTTANIAMYPWKDTSFAVGSLALMTFVLHIYFTKGEWLKKAGNIVAFVIVLTLTTFFRHNAILFTIPLLFVVLLYTTKKRGIIIILSFIILSLGVKGPLYSVLKVEKPDSRQIETLGLPMTIIGAVVTNDPASLDEETKEFAYKIASKEVWENNYMYGNFNGVKFHSDSNIQVIEEYGSGKVIGMMFNCIKTSPKTSLMGLIKLTNPLYTISDDYYMAVPPDIMYNEFGIEAGGVPLLSKLLSTYRSTCLVLFPHLFMYIGSMHIILFAVILSKYKLNKLKDWKKILPVMPVFAYNFGSMLLLTSCSDTTRFFYYTFLLIPILLAILLTKENKNERRTN